MIAAKKYFLFIIALLCTANAWAQKTITTANADSSIIITRDSRIDELIARQKDNNVLKQTIPGYRVQIYFGSVRQKAAELKLEFAATHPTVPAYITYNAPNFKVRLGNYRTRLEAQKFLHSIDGQFSTAFIVPDEVKLPVLK
jgi:hypothetical protein